MDVLGEILEWSKDRPEWQRDALRRLLLSEELTEGDIDMLTLICKCRHGLSEEQIILPLEEKHLARGNNEDGRVDLLSLYHHQGVNALAGEQTLTFGPKLTVVYGDNGAGKSGYTRIIKNACRARGAEDILGNIRSGTTSLKQSVSIKFTVGANGVPQEWVEGGCNESISRVSVFDSHSAAVYLTEKTDVAFRPFGLDLFDKLSRTCQLVRSKLEQEKMALGISLVTGVEVPQNTAVSKLIKGLSLLTEPQDIVALGTLSHEEEERKNFLEKNFFDLHANNPEKKAGELELRSRRIRMLVKHLNKVDGVLSEKAVEKVFDEQKDVKTKKTTAMQSRDSTFPAETLTGTGSDIWRELWETARKFSNEMAYANQDFPVTDECSRCVLCQQHLQDDAVTRLNNFEAFVLSTVEKGLKEAEEQYLESYKNLSELVITDDFIKDVVSEIRLENDKLASDVEICLTYAKKRLSEIIGELCNSQGESQNFTAYKNMQENLECLVTQLDQRASNLKKNNDEDEKEEMEAELRELKAREVLGRNMQFFLDEIERKKKLAALELCINDTKTKGITDKSTALTKIVVTQQLKKSFNQELLNLKFEHVEVELKEVGGELGNLYHKLVLTSAPKVDLHKVVSEGEARCLSIAAFFAELSTTNDPSAIIFDDPVSSLDYKWRTNVARRLVREAKSGQVIVFTHDIVFLLALRQIAKDEAIEQLDQHVRQLSLGAGVCEKELPWVAMPTNKRISFLKQACQHVQKMFRDGHEKKYEKEASYLYGLLREAWERGLEEVLLDGVVERYRPGVQTQQIQNIVDITKEDCNALENGISKCSKWLPGHDQAPAAKEDIPQSDELSADIDALDKWVKTIRKRRK